MTAMIKVSEMDPINFINTLTQSSYGKDGEFWKACIRNEQTYILNNLLKIFSSIMGEGFIDPKVFFDEVPEDERSQLISRFVNLVKISISYIHRERNPSGYENGRFVYSSSFMEHIPIETFADMSGLKLLCPAKE